RACTGTKERGTIDGFNNTVLERLPKSMHLIIVESVLMAVAFLAMMMMLLLCGAAYRPTEEIDLRSIGWGNIFQLPFKHMRDYRLRLLLPFFIYSGFEILFVCTGFTLSYGVCSLGLESMGTVLMAYGVAAGLGSLLSLGQLRAPRCACLYAGAALHLVLIVALYAWAPTPRDLSQRYFVYTVAVLWGLGSGLNKTGLSILLGMLYEDKDRQDFIFTLYHWWQAVAIFITYLWT
uniref:Unc-93 homolog B1, TLR signaling regulator n=1 Tax=Petromyzon marinus TaxID=7757 RepID=S4RJK9_PETMA